MLGRVALRLDFLGSDTWLLQEKRVRLEFLLLARESETRESETRESGIGLPRPPPAPRTSPARRLRQLFSLSASSPCSHLGGDFRCNFRHRFLSLGYLAAIRVLVVVIFTHVACPHRIRAAFHRAQNTLLS